MPSISDVGSLLAEATPGNHTTVDVSNETTIYIEVYGGDGGDSDGSGSAGANWNGYADVADLAGTSLDLYGGGDASGNTPGSHPTGNPGTGGSGNNASDGGAGGASSSVVAGSSEDVAIAGGGGGGGSDAVQAGGDAGNGGGGGLPGGDGGLNGSVDRDFCSGDHGLSGSDGDSLTNRPDVGGDGGDGGDINYDDLLQDCVPMGGDHAYGSTVATASYTTAEDDSNALDTTNGARVYEVSTVDPPSTPQNLTSTVSQDDITLDWDAVSWNGDEGHYDIKRGTSSGSYSEIDTVSAGTTTYTDTALLDGERYYYVVEADNSAGSSGNSNETAETTVLPAPSNLSGTLQ